MRKTFIILFISITLISEIGADECQCKSYKSQLHRNFKKQLNENPVIRVKQGRLRCTTLNSRKNTTYIACFSIPYAEPPIGELRFEKPMQAKPWKGIRDATTPGPFCTQTDFTATTVLGDEDCLHVNVFTTEISCCLKPVMVFIHGGGWTIGAGNWFQSPYLMDKDIVLVTINYRLYSLGFLSTQDDVCPGNNGLKDQVAALKWVQDNIAKFGGDPKAVTIFGQSAGAASVHYHILSPASQGLFHRAISNAGSVLSPWAYMTRGLAVKRAKKLAELLHCPNTDSLNMVNCMKYKNVSDVIMKSASLVEWYTHPSLPFRPVIEPKTAKGAFLPDIPSRLMLKSISLHTVPWIIGVNSQDGCVAASALYGTNIIPEVNEHFNYFGPTLLYYGETSRYSNIITKKIRNFYFKNGPINNNTVRQVVDMFSDSWFFHGVYKSVKMHVTVGTAAVRLYIFDYRGSVSYSGIYGDAVTNYGCCHADDLLSLFPPVPHLLSATTYSAKDERMIDYFLLWWTNFAKYGDPTFNGHKKWRPVQSLRNLEFAELNADGIHNCKGFLPKRMSFWDGISPLVYSNCYHGCDSDNLLVTIKQGTLRGHLMMSRKGREFYAYQGIPYAKPPLGDLRFRPPQSPEPWVGVLDATKDGSACFQRFLFPENNLTGSEDCLFLNVYIPKLPYWGKEQKQLDVMFWIYGGGWMFGAGDSVFYGPQYLIDKDVILVTHNYRVGPLGFLSTEDEVCPGNNGLKDQVAALQWVQDNIGEFGGNPKSVTIFGESAGAASVHYHMISPMSSGLFHRAISESGSIFCVWALSPPGVSKGRTKKLATLLGCPTESSEDLIACLKQKEAYDITNTDKEFSNWATQLVGPFRPVIEKQVEDVFLPVEAIQNFKKSENISSVPWMIGSNSEEGAFFAAIYFKDQESITQLDEHFYDIVPEGFLYGDTVASSDVYNITRQIREFYFGSESVSNYTIHSVIEMFTDGFIMMGIIKAAQLYSHRGSSPVFLYEFGYRGSNSFTDILGYRGNIGVAHADELMYLFDQELLFYNNMTLRDDKMVDLMTTIWTNFAATGNPIPKSEKLFTWLPVTSSDLEYARINSEGIAMGTMSHRKNRIDFWSSLPLNLPQGGFCPGVYPSKLAAKPNTTTSNVLFNQQAWYYLWELRRKV